MLNLPFSLGTIFQDYHFETLRELEICTQGTVVRKAINANPRLKVN